MSYRKLSPDLHQKIRQDPRSHKEIAESLGVHKDTVGRIKRLGEWRKTICQQTDTNDQDKAN